MHFCEIESEYPYEDFFIFELNEAESTAKWQIQESKNFKRGLKKYRNDKRVIDSLKILVSFIKKHDIEPPIKSYPPEFNVHIVHSTMAKKIQITDKLLWAHLKGQKIGLLFKIERVPDKKQSGLIQLIHLGTHQELGWK